MKIKVFLLSLFVILTGFLSQAQAHDLFVSVKESMAHTPGHANVIIGWGHALPVDDFFRGDKIETYAIYDPDLTRMDFAFDPKANVINNKGNGKKRLTGKKSYKAVDTRAGSYFGQQVKFKKDSAKGTYQVAVTSELFGFAMWINHKGRRKWGSDITLDQIKDAREIIISTLHFYSGKAFVTVGEWTEPKPLDHKLEIIPTTDLSRVRAGDEVSFTVLLKGKPLSSDPVKPETLKANSELFGKGNKYSISAPIINGMATFQVPTPGQWLISLHLLEPVNKKNGPRDMVGKYLNIGYNASVTFHAK